MSVMQRYRDLGEAQPTLSPGELRFERRRRTLGLLLGPALFLLLWFIPVADSPPAAHLAAVLAWVLTWWISEAVPIPVTALLGPSLSVMTGVGSAKQMFAPFGDPIIFLFLGSFLLAEAMFASRLDRRFAYAILGWRWVGSSATRILIAFAGITALLSMWLSNTATTAMMYPIGVSILAALSQLVSRQRGEVVDMTRLRYGTALMLATAYAASIGGIATPVGTPPNLIALGLLDELAGVRIPFFTWMLLAAPIMLLMLGLLLVYLRRALPPELENIQGSRELILTEQRSLGAWTRAQRNTLVAFATTVSLWVLPGLVAAVLGPDAPASRALAQLLPEAVVALIGGLLLFVLPTDWPARRFTLTWNQAVRIDWGTLLLFGCGLSLGGAMFETGLATGLGARLVTLTEADSVIALTLLFSAVTLFLTETTSNTAGVTIMCPLAIATAQVAGVSPIPPAVAVALASSMAFMLPVATPPNAIVYGSGCVSITAMVRHGLVLNLLCLLLVPGLVLLLCRLLGLA